MRWFKHHTDNHRGQSVQFLLDEGDYFAVYFYYMVLEMCAEKLEQKESTELTEEDCRFRFHRRVVCSASRAKPSTVTRASLLGASCGFWSYSLDGEYIEFYVPMLLNLLGRDQKKARYERGKYSPKSAPRVEKSRVEKSRVEYILPKTKKTEVASALNRELNKNIWESYRAAYISRYKVEPTRNASVNGKISQLAKRLGADAIPVVEFFLQHNASFYLQQTHSIGLCLKDAESLRTQWLRGKAITGTAARNFEKTSESMDQAEKFRRMANEQRSRS